MENCLGWSPGKEVLERKVMLEQSMALKEIKKAVMHHETSPAPTNWARFCNCPNQLVAQYFGTVVSRPAALSQYEIYVKKLREQSH